MAFIKSEIKVSELVKGDIFRMVESVGNLRQTVEYVVVSAKIETNVMHVGDSGTTREVQTSVIKVTNRRNGANKTKKYNPTVSITVYRQEV